MRTPHKHVAAGGLRLTLLLAALGLFLARPAAAQQAQAETQTLPAVTVIGQQPVYPALPRLTEPVLDTPQTIIEVPAQQATDQGATSLEDTVRYVPGISIHANEDTSQRNQFYVRGFSSENDRYLDGMLEIGDWYMDPFDMQRLEVLEGPAGVLFGRGSTGGVVNYVSKVPQLAPLTDIDTSLGTDGTRRVTVDFDRAIDATTALRINMLGYDGGVADRNTVNFGRFGFAPSIAFGIGTPTRVTFSVLHQTENDLPDYGVPWIDVGTPGSIARPALVPRQNFYGFDSDFSHSDVNILTLRAEHDLSEAVTITDQLRYGNYTRSFRITEPEIPGIIAPGTPLADITVTRSIQGLDSLETFLDNQSEAHLSFDTWGVLNRAVAGMEFGRQTSSPTFFQYAGVPTTNLLAPDPDQAFTATTSVSRIVSVVALTQAAYLIDTVHLSDDWLLTAAARLDRFDASVNRTPPVFEYEHVDTEPTWRTGLTYKPEKNSSLYFVTGTSFDPSAEGLSLAANNAALAPEHSQTYETGAKQQIGGLLLSGALFRTTLYNVRESDPADPTLLILAGTARVDGFELLATGDPLPRWHLFGGYTFLQTAIIASPNHDLGFRLQNAPKHAAKLWTLYDLMPDLAVGGGVQYVGNRTVMSGPDPNGFLQLVPGYWTMDLMARYRIREWLSVQLNLKNLNNAYGYDGIDNNHVVPLAGRSALFTVSAQF